MTTLPQKTNTLWIDSLRRWGQWLGQFPGYGKTGIAGMVAWMMAARANCANLTFDVRLSTCVLAVMSLLFEVGAQATQQYSITDIGTFGSRANGINNRGQVVGDYSGHNGFIYNNGVTIELSTVGFMSDVTADINDNGQIIGHINSHAFLYSDGIISDLGSLGGGSSQAYRINNSGQVVGRSYANNGKPHAFLYASGVMSDLGTLGGNNSYAYDINDNGQIVGISMTAENRWQAYLYSNGVMRSLGTLGGTYSDSDTFYAINNSGQIVGASSLAGDREIHAFLYSDGIMTDLGTLGGTYSAANDINNSGQIIGLSSLTGDTSTTPFIYSNGVMTDLNKLLASNDVGWVLRYAAAINDAGQIAGTGIINGQRHAFLLTPFALEILDPLCTDKTTCATAKFITQQNDGTVRLSQDPATLMQANVQRDGAVADGVTRLLLRVRSDTPVTFTLKPEDGSTPAETDACLWGSLENLEGLIGPSCKSITVNPQDVPNVGKVVFAVFRAPDSVPQASASAFQVSRNVTIEAKSDTLSTTQTLSLQAPPVILIHGVWSSPDAWQKTITGLTIPELPATFEYGLSTLGLDVYLVDHSDIEGSASSFDPQTNAQVFGRVDGQVKTAKEIVRSRGKNGVAITQVDVVGHSMGGLIARARTVAKNLPYLRTENAGQGDFHKLITIGTPHRGTPLADALIEKHCNEIDYVSCTKVDAFGNCTKLELKTLWTLESFFKEKANKPLGPAILGFQTGSKAIKNIGATNSVRSAAIVGSGPVNSDTENNLNNIMWAFHTGKTIAGLLGGNGNHDTIVDMDSQEGSLPVNAFKVVNNVVHADVEAEDLTGIGTSDDVNETRSIEVFNQVKDLLLKPAKSSDFDHFTSSVISGTYYSLTCPPTVASAQSVTAKSSSVSATAAPSITLLPAPGTVIRPGQSVTLTFNVTGGIPTEKGMFAVNKALRFINGAPPYSLIYTAPNNRAGLVKVSAFAFGTANYGADTSLIVLPAQPPTQLTATPSNLSFSLQGASLPLIVTGIYADSSQIDLTAAEAGTTYATQSGNSNVVSVSTAGLVTAKGNGSDFIIVSNSGKTATVPVTVNITNHTPVIQIQGGTDLTLAPGSATTLTVKATDPEGNAVALSLLDPPAFASFADQGGGNGTLALNPLPPDVGPHSFHVYALDNGTPPLGVTAAIQVQVGAASANQAPVANAGTDQSVINGAMVMLNGTASSDPDHGPSPLTYAWIQISGPAVTLDGAAGANPTFNPAQTGDYVFGLVVNDGQAGSPQSTVTVHVGMGSQTISFGAAPMMLAGGTGTVSATGGASGNPVIFSSATPSVCTVNGSTVTGVSAGLCTLFANQAGNASYSAAPQATLSFSIMSGFVLTVGNANSGGGTVLSDVGGIDCGGTCSSSFASGLAVNLTAIPVDGYQFSGWGGDCRVCGYGNACTVTMDAAKSCAASFEVFKRRRPIWKRVLLPQ